jgi:uncharacterized protein YkwD
MNRPKFTRIQLAIVALVCAGAAAAVLIPSRAPASISLDTQEAEMCRTINAYRAANGLPELLVSERLTAASEWYSTDMATKDYVNPDHADSLDRTVKQRIVFFGYDYSTYYGENIAWGRAGAAATFDAWKNSSVHNANMLNPNFKVIGIGRATDSSSQYGTYWTTDFGGVVDPNAVACPGSGGTPSPGPSATTTTSPSPTPSGPAVSVADAAVVEGNSTSGATKAIKFTVRIPRAYSTKVRVSWATSNGTATAGSDYQAASGAVTIRPGNTSAVITVRVIKDRAVEGDETFQVALSNPENATIADGTAIGTITNDD